MPPEPQFCHPGNLRVFQELQEIIFITCTQAHQNPIPTLWHLLSMSPKPLVPSTCPDLPNSSHAPLHLPIPTLVPLYLLSLLVEHAWLPFQIITTSCLLSQVTLITSPCFNCFTGSSLSEIISVSVDLFACRPHSTISSKRAEACLSRSLLCLQSTAQNMPYSKRLPEFHLAEANNRSNSALPLNF